MAMIRKPMNMGQVRQKFSSMSAKLSNSYRVTDWGRSRWSDARTTASGNLHNSTSDLESMRSQSYAMDRNNGVWQGVMDRAVDNIVGSGPTFQMQTGDDEIDEILEARMAQYAEHEIDMQGLRNLREILRGTMWSVFHGGDHSFIMTDSGQLQGIEADLICDNFTNAGTADGLEFDSTGKITAFHVGRWSDYGYLDRTNTTRVPAEFMLYLPNLRRWSSARGIPIQASNIELFERFDDYIEATVVAAQLGACQAVAIKTAAGGDLGENLSESETSENEDDQRVSEWEPGVTWFLRPGEDVSQIKPEHPTTQFQPFTQSLLRLIGLPLGLPLELVLLDFSDTNYSAARAAFLQAFINFRNWQFFLDSRLLRPMTQWKLTHFLRELGIPDTPKNRKFVWIPSGWAWIDPLKEAEGSEVAIDLGLTTLRDEAAKYGKFWKDNIIQRGKELKLMKEHGVEPKEKPQQIIAPQKPTEDENE